MGAPGPARTTGLFAHLLGGHREQKRSACQRNCRPGRRIAESRLFKLPALERSTPRRAEPPMPLGAGAVAPPVGCCLHAFQHPTSVPEGWAINKAECGPVCQWVVQREGESVQRRVFQKEKEKRGEFIWKAFFIPKHPHSATRRHPSVPRTNAHTVSFRLAAAGRGGRVTDWAPPGREVRRVSSPVGHTRDPVGRVPLRDRSLRRTVPPSGVAAPSRLGGSPQRAD